MPETLGNQISRTLKLFDGPLRTLLIWPQIDVAQKHYVATLKFWHSIIRASVPLMHLAATNIDAKNPKGPNPLSEYLKDHIIEEDQHDTWLLEDLKSIGESDEWFVPEFEVARLVGMQYYWINHYSPVAIAGYIAALEGLPPHRENINLLMEATGFPESAFRTLAFHSDNDPGHFTELLEVLDKLDLSDVEQALVVRNCASTLVALVSLLNSKRIMG